MNRRFLYTSAIKHIAAHGTLHDAATEVADRLNPRLPSRRLNRFVVCMVFGILTINSSLRAADAGITVIGTGEAKAKPTSVELSANVGAEAELTADAVVKFNDARKKAVDALNNLKLADLKIEPGGMSLSSAVDAQSQMRMMNGMGGQTKAPKTRVAEDLKLVIGGIDKLKANELTDSIMKVIDTGRDAGLTIGPKTPSNYYEAQMMAQTGGGYSITLFRLDNANVLRDQAYQAAMDDAKQKAGRLAKLAGVALGPVVSIQETTATTEPGNFRAAVFSALNGGGSEEKTITATSPRLDDIPVKVTISVQFSIASK